MSVASEFLNYSTEKLELYLDRIETCVDKLTPEQVWARQSENENAVGNLILHLDGNIRQWIIGGVGGQRDIRDRNAEFDARGGASTAELKARLRGTIEEAAAIVRGVTPERLTERIRPQGYDASVLEGIYQVVQHLAGHAFQIMLLTKLYTSQDLGFFAHLRQASGAQSGRP
ncbi:MAG: DUF1572 family protein [Bryobacteraceae bacterium]|jgi:uncharacterized damage-inducible protein DinB